MVIFILGLETIYFAKTHIFLKIWCLVFIQKDGHQCTHKPDLTSQWLFYQSPFWKKKSSVLSILFWKRRSQEWLYQLEANMLFQIRGSDWGICRDFVNSFYFWTCSLGCSREKLVCSLRLQLSIIEGATTALNEGQLNDQEGKVQSSGSGSFYTCSLSEKTCLLY